MSVVLALKWEILPAGLAHILPSFVFVLMSRERQLVVEGLSAVFAVHYAMGTAMVVFQLLCSMYPNTTHATAIFLCSFAF